MKTSLISLILVAILAVPAFAWAGEPIEVVSTLQDYGSIAARIGGDRVHVRSLVLGDQDAHFIRPKPSFITTVSEADLLIATGLDLELWLPTIIDKSGNTKVRSEHDGYVAASDGMKLLEVPEAVSRSEGGVHLYGNPHVTCSPLNIRTAARNITAGLINVDPDGEKIFLANLKDFEKELDERLFGAELVSILGGKTLGKLAGNGKLMSFLESNDYEGKPLLDYLGGWMKELMPLRGKKIVTYHKNWVYFTRIFGLVEAGTIEPKPGIPPSAKHVSEVITMMKDNDIRVILAASYYNQDQVKDVAAKTGAKALIVPAYVNGLSETGDYFQLMDYWVEQLLAGAVEKGMNDG